MITSIEAKNFRSLKYIHQRLDKFNVLIGANASGKTTFLDVISFISDIVNNGIDYAIHKRTNNFIDLTFSSLGGDIELALEAKLPKNVIDKLGNRNLDTIRYEIRIGLVIETNEHAVKEERVLLIDSFAHNFDYNIIQKSLFPEIVSEPASILNKTYQRKKFKLVIKKKPGGNDNFYDETYERSGKGWMPSFKLGIKKSALGSLPADETKFPAATWLKEFIVDGVQLFILDSLNIREASPPGQISKFKTDGSNLPWVIKRA